MRVTLGVGVTRAGVDELITGLWSFANALGLLTDDIGERTAAAGVTIDGLLVKDSGIPQASVSAHEAALAILESQIADGTILARLGAAEIITGAWRFNAVMDHRARSEYIELATSVTTFILSKITGESASRFDIEASGKMNWGGGAGAFDTNLFRSAANNLKTDDSFNVGTSLRALGGFEMSVQASTFAARVDNFALDGKSIQRILLTGAQSLTGMAGGIENAIVYLSNIDTADALTVTHEDANSSAANRFSLRFGSSKTIDFHETVGFWYDGTSSRWRMLTR